MVLIVCVDDDLGMAFAKRRQSQDCLLRRHIIQKFDDIIHMNGYSAKQFLNEGMARISVSENFLNDAEKGDFCFAENVDVSQYEYKTEKIVLYRWNRKYPSDLKFSIPLDENGWKLESSVEFAGNSHEKITEEVYVR